MSDKTKHLSGEPITVISITLRGRDEEAQRNCAGEIEREAKRLSKSYGISAQATIDEEGVTR